MHDGVRYRGLGGTTKTRAQRTLEKIRSKVINEEFEIVEKPNNPKFEKFSETFLDMIDLLKSIGKNDSEFVFLNARGDRLKSVRKPFQNALKKAGILNFRFHDLSPPL